jgi:hypothetical protein
MLGRLHDADCCMTSLAWMAGFNEQCSRVWSEHLNAVRVAEAVGQGACVVSCKGVGLTTVAAAHAACSLWHSWRIFLKAQLLEVQLVLEHQEQLVLESAERTPCNSSFLTALLCVLSQSSAPTTMFALPLLCCIDVSNEDAPLPISCMVPSRRNTASKNWGVV